MSKADQAYQQLSEMIETGKLQPGDAYTETTFMEVLGFGRTPVREAIQRLDRDHLVNIIPGRGILVPVNSVDDQLRRLEVRRTLESLAVTLASERASTEENEKFLTLSEQLTAVESMESYIRIVRDTHELVSSSTRNVYLIESITPLHVLSRKFWLAHLKTSDDQQTGISDGAPLHAELLKCLAQRDAPAARQASLRLNDYLIDFALASTSTYAQKYKHHLE